MSILGSARIASIIGLLTLLPLSHPAGGGDAPNGDAGMTRCAAMTQPSARLACYDALAASANRSTSPAANQPPSAVPPATVPSATARPATAPPAIAPAGVSGDPGNFGLSSPPLRPISTGPSSIEARVATISAGQMGVGHPTVFLDNGQTWAFSEALDDPRLVPGSTVTIKRATLGSFLLTTASQRTYHVHRTH